jgi:hypothetical protein
MAIPLTSNKLFTRSNVLGWICLIILILTVSIVVYYRVRMQTTIGPFWDTYSFLDNALEYAGMGTGYIELDRSPFLPFLTSILFRMGFVSEMAISLMEGLIFIFGVTGLYLLLKLRFNPLESLAGSTIYISFPVILAWLGIGYLDIAAVALSIWAVYLTILAVKKKPKIFLSSLSHGHDGIFNPFYCRIPIIPHHTLHINWWQLPPEPERDDHGSNLQYLNYNSLPGIHVPESRGPLHHLHQPPQHTIRVTIRTRCLLNRSTVLLENNGPVHIHPRISP